mmetsp:Transcript_34560/g.87197  ORF Transcript_34560/g.87197 Transcript_34560/m.87197 type:complete len:212 (-) Transcript_34560:74-709(-)
MYISSPAGTACRPQSPDTTASCSCATRGRCCQPWRLRRKEREAWLSLGVQLLGRRLVPWPPWHSLRLPAGWQQAQPQRFPRTAQGSPRHLCWFAPEGAGKGARLRGTEAGQAAAVDAPPHWYIRSPSARSLAAQPPEFPRKAQESRRRSCWFDPNGAGWAPTLICTEAALLEAVEAADPRRTMMLHLLPCPTRSHRAEKQKTRRQGAAPDH